jgi:hypothetical protein
MVHCGYEPTAANDAMSNPLKAAWVAIRGIKTEGAMAKKIDLSKQRPAEYMFSKHVEEALVTVHAAKAKKAAATTEDKETVEAAE